MRALKSFVAPSCFFIGNLETNYRSATANVGKTLTVKVPNARGSHRGFPFLKMKDDYQKKYTAGPEESVPNVFIASLSLYDVKQKPQLELWVPLEIRILIDT